MGFKELIQEPWRRARERHFSIPRIWKPCVKCGKRTYFWTWYPRTMVNLVCGKCGDGLPLLIPALPEKWVP